VLTVALPVQRAGEYAVPAPDPATDRVHRLWAAGDDLRIAAGYRHLAESFVARRQLEAGVAVLDAACGTGTATVPAARTDAAVTGLDLVVPALQVATLRAAGERVTVTFDRGTVEQMSYADAAFDVVLSLFGVMFAARPDRVLAEIERVTRPGGRVALASWTPGGFMGELHALQNAFVPPSLELPDPLGWGDPAMVQEWLDDREWEVTTAVRVSSLRYPHTPAGTAELFRAAYPPTVRAFGDLDEDRRATLAEQLTALWARRHRQGAAGTDVEVEYLEVEATRRGS
jgi:SAM-dependent methyltransferase